MKEYKYVIIENQSFPAVNWNKFLFLNRYIILLSGERYRKMSFRNRYVLAGSNGLINLSVPLVNGRNQKLSFNEIRIANKENWQLTHWRTITSCYSKSPYFEYYESALQNFFTDRWEFLFDWNLSVLQWLKTVLKFPAEITILERPPEQAEDMRDMWLPKNFQEGEILFRYPQVFEDRIGFQNNLSILDMLFNMGPNAAKLFVHSSLYNDWHLNYKR